MEVFNFYFYNSDYETYRESSLEMEDIYQIHFKDTKWYMLNEINKIWLLCYIKYLCAEFNWDQLIKIHEIPNSIKITEFDIDDY